MRKISFPVVLGINLMILLFALVSKASAQVGTVLGAPSACIVRTFYVDYGSGNDSSAGTKGNPWKRQPYMAGWTGSYKHNAGDCFIFRGGVTWDHAAMPLYATAGGTSANPDYYGVDQTWYAGSAWTRPIFDCQSTVGCNQIVQTAASYITFDSLEWRGIWLAANVKGWTFYSSGPNSPGLVLNNLNIHNWRMDHNWSDDDAYGGIYFCCGGGSGDGDNVQNSLIHNEDGGYMAAGNGSIQLPGAGGVAVSQMQNLTFNEIHDVSSVALHGGMLVHDNYIHDTVSSWCMSCELGGTDGYHTNVLYLDSWQYGGITLPQYIYRNRIINVHQNAASIYPWGCYFGDTTSTVSTYIYDNLVTGPYSFPFAIDFDAGDNGCMKVTWKAYVFNNTIQVPTGDDTGCGRTTPGRPGTQINQIVYENNHCIADKNPWNFSATAGVTGSNNISQTNAAAASQGYTASNNFAPQSGQASLATAGKGVSVSTQCPSCPGVSQDINLVSRTPSWDAGAYEIGGGSNVTAPTGLAAIVQ